MTQKQIDYMGLCGFFVWLLILAGALKGCAVFKRAEQIDDMEKRIQTLEATAGQPDASLGPVIPIMPRARPAVEQLL